MLQHRFALVNEQPDKSRSWRDWASLSQTCGVCKRPFLGGLLGTCVQCKHCGFLSCQSCAANQADWDAGMHGCAASAATAKYSSLEDVDIAPAKSVLPPEVRDAHKDIVRRHDHLMECLGSFRAVARTYREELDKAVKDYADAAARGDHDPGELSELLQERLSVVRQRLSDHSSAASDLVSMLVPRSESSAGDRGGLDRTASGSAGGGGAASSLLSSSLQPLTALEVSAVPIFDRGVAEGVSEVNVTRLLHKICKYRDDQEIEEGLCSRLSSVLKQASHKVEFYLPALASIIVHVDHEMPFLVRELIRLCTYSSHFALLLLWNVQTSTLRDVNGVLKLQMAMHTLEFEGEEQERLARLLWLIMGAVAVGEGGDCEGS